MSVPEGGTGAPSAEVLLANLRAVRRERRRLERVVDRLEATLAMQQRALEDVQNSFGWRLLRSTRAARDRMFARHLVMRALLDRALGAVKRLLGRRVDGAGRDDVLDPYAAWVVTHTPSPEELAVMQQETALLLPHIRFSLIVVVGDVTDRDLRRSLASVRAQVRDDWELVLVDAAHIPQLQPVLTAALEDGRVQVERLARPGGRAVALARGIATATGDRIAFLSAGDRLAPEALHEIALELEATPEADVVYADEDVEDDDGCRSSPLFKPEWSPDLLLSMPYLGRMVVYRRELLAEVGGTEPALGGAEDWDLALRMTERARRIAHVSKVLYHAGGCTESAGEETAEAGRRAVSDALARRGLDGRVEPTGRPVHRIRYAIRGTPLVSIIMPTRDKAAVLRDCVESIEARTSWARRELLVVDNGSTERDARRYLTGLARCHRVLRDPRPFNWSALNNAAAREASGEYLLFINNDMEVLATDWIEALLEHAQRTEVGVVGAKLLYPNRTLQHAGVVLGIGVADHAFKRLPDEAPSYCWLAHAVRDVSAVTGACMMVRRETFARLGGFDERLRVAFNDIDFCLRARAEGLLVVYTPFATLVHHESLTRRALHPPEDEALVRARWRAALLDDPYYSPHLTRERTDYSVRA